MGRNRKQPELSEREELFLSLVMYVYFNRCEGISTATLRKVKELFDNDPGNENDDE